MTTMTSYHDGRLVVWGGDCLTLLAALAPDSVDAIVTDPPYGLGFMGKKWDDLPPGREWAEACYRVLKPGGHLLAFGGTRTWHRLAVAIEDGGFEIRDSLAWLYGSGFPKSMDVAKAIDKAARGVPQGGADPTSPNHGKFRTTTTEGKRWDGDKGQGYGAGGSRFLADGTASGSATAPAASGAADVVAEAQQWEGWGTALKPAFEPIVVGRKPLVGTVAANVLAHGTGALNIDGCRIHTTDKLRGGHGSAGQQMTDGWERPWMSDPDAVAANAARAREAQAKAEELGRWPANVILDESQAEVLDEQSGTLKSGANPAIRGGDKDKRQVYGGFTGGRNEQPRRGTDIGGASRFFFTPTSNEEPPCATPTEPALTTPETGAPSARSAASTAERSAPPAGTSGVPLDELPARFLYAAKASKRERPVIELADGTRLAHPTVKPLAVMRWLVRLVTPPNGLVLDTFAGTGTTGEACVLEGFRCLLAEDPTKGEQDYLPLIDQRITRAVAALPKTEPMEQTA